VRRSNNKSVNHYLLNPKNSPSEAMRMACSGVTRENEKKDRGYQSNQNHDGNRPSSASLLDINDDPHDLFRRFVANHARMFPTALAEINEGYKRSCWLWFVLPSAPFVVDSVERGSARNRHFALRGDEAVVAYLGCRSKYTYQLSEKEDDDYGLSDATPKVFRIISLHDNYIAIVSAIVRQLEKGNTMDELLGPMDVDKALSSFRLFGRVAGEVTGDAELAGLCQRALELVSSSAKEKTSKWAKKLHAWTGTRSF